MTDEMNTENPVSERKKELIGQYVEEKDQHDVPPEINRELCEGCTICCEHVALEIDEPEDEDDFQNLMWYVMHKNVIVFMDDDNDWYVEFKSPCKHLTEDGLCEVHSDRPKVCIEYSQDSCEKHGEGSPYAVLFKERQEVIDWVRKNTKFKLFGYKSRY